MKSVIVFSVPPDIIYKSINLISTLTH